MAYCTTAQIEAQFPLLADKIDSTAADYIARADGMINTVLSGANYVTPVVLPTKDIEMWSIYGAALQAGIQVLSTAQSESPFHFPNIFTWYEFIKNEVKAGKLSIPRNTYAASVTSDDLEDPDYSEFKMPEGFALNSD